MDGQETTTGRVTAAQGVFTAAEGGRSKLNALRNEIINYRHMQQGKADNKESGRGQGAPLLLFVLFVCLFVCVCVSDQKVKRTVKSNL